MKYLRFQDIDRARWDKLVDESTNPRIYMLSWYLEICCRSCKAVVWGDFDAVMPLNVKAFLGIRYVSPPPLVQQAGIIFKPSFDGREAVSRFFRSGTFKRFARFGMTFHSATGLDGSGLPPGTRLEKKKNYVLSLSGNYGTLYKAYSENRKRNLKKALANGWKTAVSDDIEAAILMYRQNQALKQEDLKDTYRVVKDLYRACVKRNAGLLLKCVDEHGEALSYCFFAMYRNRVYYLFGAMNEKGRKHSAITCGFDQIIRTYAGQDSFLDFEGGNIESLGNYFASFGASPEEYFFVSRRLF